MKLKVKLLTIFAAIGVVASGFGAWAFADKTTAEAGINVSIEAASGSIGSIDFDPIGIYNLADDPNPLVFNGKFTPESGINAADVDLTYKVSLNAALGELISFGAVSEGVWVSEVPTSITPVWNAGKNPQSIEAYNAIKDNLANLQMTITLKAAKKEVVAPVAPAAIIPGPLPAGLVEGEGGVIDYDKELGPIQLSVQGVDGDGSTLGVAQEFNWSSSDSTKATVVNGLVTPLSDGEVTITATAPSAPVLPKRAPGSPAKYDFKLRISGFTPIFVPIATTIELVLGPGVSNQMELLIGDQIAVSAQVLDQNGDVMTGLEIEYDLDNQETATYVDGVLTALAVEDDGMILFGYGPLVVSFEFSIVAPAPDIDRINIKGSSPLVLDYEEFGEGQLEAEVIDSNNAVMSEEEVVWSAPNEDVIVLDDDGYYIIVAPGTVTVTATSVTDSSIKADLVVTVNEPPVVEHTVTLVYDNGNPNGSTQVVDGEKMSKPTDPIKENHTFVEWQKDGVAYNFDSAVTSDITLTAVYTKNTYSVIFNANEGSSVEPQTVAHGELASKPADPSRDGYEFVNWMIGEEVYDFTTPVTGTVNLTAEWLIKSYTVTFESNGGSTVAQATVTHGATVAAPTAPTKVGHTFVEWQKDGVAYDFATPVTSAITLVAKWNIVSYQVSFNTGSGGNTIAPVNVNHGAKVTKPADPTRPGYEFYEWRLNGVAYDFNDPVTAPITLVAEWDVADGVPKLNLGLQRPAYEFGNGSGWGHFFIVTNAGDIGQYLDIYNEALADVIQHVKLNGVSGRPTNVKNLGGGRYEFWFNNDTLKEGDKIIITRGMPIYRYTGTVSGAHQPQGDGVYNKVGKLAKEYEFVYGPLVENNNWSLVAIR